MSGVMRILELGAGSSGLAGLALWQVASGLKGVQASLRLTDGEIENINFLQENILLNIGSSESNQASKLLWGDVSII
jgi:tRNA1(Val) A37 N6-methylase TrmN6